MCKTLRFKKGLSGISDDSETWMEAIACLISSGVTSLCLLNFENPDNQSTSRGTFFLIAKCIETMQKLHVAQVLLSE